MGEMVQLPNVECPLIILAVGRMITHRLHANSTAGMDLSSREVSTPLRSGYDLEFVLASRSAIL